MKKNVYKILTLSLVFLSILLTQGFGEAQGLPIFGAQMNDAIAEAQGLTQAVNGGVYWVRFDAFEWDRIEPLRTAPPTFHWEYVDEGSLQRADQNGLKVIAVVKYTPDWAQKYPGSGCGPIKSTAFTAFAEFLTEAVRRYKDPPYNIKYWELGNEIDAPVYYERSVFGCWGDVNDPYFGGEYYAQMLKAAYPAIKAADPQAQVLLGGLILDNPYEISNTIARFFEGVLLGGGGPFFDLVNFHSYSYFTGIPGLLYNPNWPGSPTSLPEKVEFLKGILNRYGLGDKPLINTETALYCDVDTDPCFETQAVFTAKAYAEGVALGLRGVVYYALKSEWRLTGLLRPDNTPRPSYLAFKTAADFLTLAHYRGPVSGYPAGISGHAYWPQVGTPVDVIWATDGAPQSVPLPSGAAAFDRYGIPLLISADKITVDYGPVYIRKPLVINNGALSTTFTGVRLALSGKAVFGKVVWMRFSNDGTAWSDWETVADLRLWTLSNGDGLKTVYVQLKDEIGNASLPISASITLDTAAGGEYGFSINQGALFTNQTPITLTIGAGPFASEMMVSNDSGFAGSQWEPFTSRKSWELSRYGNFTIPRVVYVKYKKIDGTILSVYQDDIILDVRPPQGSAQVVKASVGQVVISGADLEYRGGLSNAGYKIFLPLIQKPIQGTLVKLELTASDDISGVGHMMISNNSDFSDAYWEPYKTPRDWGMTGSTVYVKFRDKAGNISRIYSASTP